MPRLEGGQLHLGFLLALLAAVAVWWILDRSTTGFAIRAVGANPSAAATAGMSVARTTIIAMSWQARWPGWRAFRLPWVRLLQAYPCR